VIVFYISGHGFGHASREVEVINALGARHGQPILIRSAVSPDLLQRTVRVPFVLDAGPCDTGIVQASSVDHDDEATVDNALAFYGAFDAHVAHEIDRLAPHAIDAIVGDIPPIAFEVAARLGVPGIALANFTWDWIYEAHPGFLPRGAQAIDTIRRAYGQATRALQLPFAGGFDVFREVTPLPLVARRPTRTRADTRARFGLPQDGPAALLSFGGYGLPSLALDRLDAAPEWTVVTTTRTGLAQMATPPHVVVIDETRFLDSGFRYEDLVAAVDVVVTKPGYGIISECMAGETAMLYTSRGAFREYALLVDALPRYVRSRFISQDDLFAGRWREALDALAAQPDPPERIDANGADVAADLIAAIAGAGDAAPNARSSSRSGSGRAGSSG
jgi:L-arabinokinase